MIYRRKSVRQFDSRPVEDSVLEQIRQFYHAAKPLDGEIGVTAKIVSKEQVRFYLPWKAPHLIAVYSEEKPGYLENVGFLFQQVELYLQSMGLGACWMGLGKLRAEQTVEGMRFVILIAFGYPAEEQLRGKVEEFRRKELSQISDSEDPRLEPARLAPSSTNSQPWYFAHQAEVIHAYCSYSGILRHAMLGVMNRIDMGIALAHMYVANPGTFRYFQTDAPEKTGYRYTGSFMI